MAEGTVKWFNAEKGYGFIIRNHVADIFFEHTQVIPPGYILQAGDRVSFTIIDGPNGQQATDVTKIGTDPSFVPHPLLGNQQSSNTLATVSLGLGVTGFPFLCLSVVFGICSCVSGLIAIAALVTGFMARQQIKVSGEQGNGLALIGIIAGGAQIILVICVVLFWLVLILVSIMIQILPLIGSGLQ